MRFGTDFQTIGRMIIANPVGSPVSARSLPELPSKVSPAKEEQQKIRIRPEYSAVAPKNSDKPSRSVRAAIEVLREADAVRVCEVGYGLLAQTPHILDAFPDVVLIDTKEQYERVKDRLSEVIGKHRVRATILDVEVFREMDLALDGSIIINVLHVLPLRESRLEVLNLSWKNLREGGIIFVDVPRNEYYYRRTLLKTATPYGDGYAMRRGDYYTFYKNMSIEELTEYLEVVGFTVERRVTIDHRVTLVGRKAPTT